jgi:hypothetical protein
MTPTSFRTPIKRRNAPGEAAMATAEDEVAAE